MHATKTPLGRYSATVSSVLRSLNLKIMTNELRAVYLNVFHPM